MSPVTNTTQLKVDQHGNGLEFSSAHQPKPPHILAFRHHWSGGGPVRAARSTSTCAVGAGGAVGTANAVGQSKAGNAKALNALKGPVMKATKGKANPAMLDQLLKKLIDEG